MSDTTTSASEEPPLLWTAATQTQHAGRALDRPRPVLLGRTWSYEPASCVTGVRVIALRTADGAFVCPLCGLQTS